MTFKVGYASDSWASCSAIIWQQLTRL